MHRIFMFLLFNKKKNLYLSSRSRLLGSDQPAVEHVQQRAPPVADQRRAGQAAVRPVPAVSAHRQAQGRWYDFKVDGFMDRRRRRRAEDNFRAKSFSPALRSLEAKDLLEHFVTMNLIMVRLSGSFRSFAAVSGFRLLKR